MKRTLLFILLAVFSFSVMAQDTWSRVKIYTGDDGLKQLSAAGIDLTEGTLKKGAWFETDLSGRELEKVKQLGLKYEVKINDVSAYYAKRSAAESNLTVNRDINEEWPVPEHWEYGSMGGFYTLDEVMAELDSMAILYPDLISVRAPISNDTLTHEGRKLWWVRLSDNPNTNEDEPEILYTGVHHAREPMSVQQMIWYMWYLLENYDSDPDIQTLVNNTEMYFVPVVNPDGYEYNHITNPDGGGMWRKNRRNNGDGSYGVDPNRNYGFQWGHDNSGSSPDSWSETYRGPAPFSEPCIKNMRDFANEHEFLLALNYHSYSDLLLYPWGYTSSVTPDNDLMHDYGTMMVQENGYTYGPSSTTIYPTNGDANDWMYGEQVTKGKILSYTPEVGSNSDGFWPPVSRIIPLCREQMWQNITAARLVGKYATLTNRTPLVTGETENYARFVIKRIGLTDCPDFKVFLQPLDNNIVGVGDTVHFYNMELMEEHFDSVYYVLRPDIESGTMYRFLLSVDNGDYVRSDTVTAYFGTEVVVFSDSCENMDNWSSGKWNITTESSHSPTRSITDSPFSYYQNNQTSIITLDSVIDLRDTPVAFLRFWCKWDIEAGWDYAQVEAKDINSSLWEPLEGKFTHPGNGNQQEGAPLYDGTMEDWVQEEVVLSQFVGKQIKLRFLLHSDEFVNADGYYFDDLTVSLLSNSLGIKHQNIQKSGLNIISVYPNPAKETLHLFYESNGDNRQLTLEVYSVTGKKVIDRQILDSFGKAKVPVARLPKGLYYVRLRNGKETTPVKKFVKQ